MSPGRLSTRCSNDLSNSSSRPAFILSYGLRPLGWLAAVFQDVWDFVDFGWSAFRRTIQPGTRLHKKYSYRRWAPTAGIVGRFCRSLDIGWYILDITTRNESGVFVRICSSLTLERGRKWCCTAEWSEYEGGWERPLPFRLTPTLGRCSFGE